MKSIKSFLFRIINSIKIMVWAYKNPKTLRVHHFKLLVDLFNLILSASEKNRHMMGKICVFHPEIGEHSIVSLWVGAGLEADPYDRINELLRENSMLRDAIKEQISKNNKVYGTSI